MADEPTTTRRALWETAFNELTALNQKLDQCRPEDRDALERTVAAQEQELLDMPAPSFGAVITKLELMWSAELQGMDAESEAKRLILEDLSDLIAENRQPLGEAV